MMDKLAINLRALRTLVLIHDTKSFQKTARLAGQAQSAVSMQISALERELGVQLFDRRVRPPTMTVAAMSIVKSAREILALLDTIEAAVSGEASADGTFSLGAIPTATLTLVPDTLGWLAQRYPELRIAVRSGLSANLIGDVVSGHLDAAVVTAPITTPPALRVHTLFEERLVFVSAYGKKVEPRLENLGDLAFIRFDRSVGVGAIIDDFLVRTGAQPADFMELDSFEAILAMVERGLGVAIVPERTVAARGHRVLMTPIADPHARRTVAFVEREDDPRSGLLDTVLRALRRISDGGAPFIINASEYN